MFNFKIDFLKILTCLLFCILLFISCDYSRNRPIDKNKTILSRIVRDTFELNTVVDSFIESSTLKARFIEFHLGDAEHYIFRDESGRSWDFAGAECVNFNFTFELNENEADESNQGWGSNINLQEKWFILTYIRREQPQYIDGPIVEVEIITKAVLVED